MHKLMLFAGAAALLAAAPALAQGQGKGQGGGKGGEHAADHRGGGGKEARGGGQDRKGRDAAREARGPKRADRDPNRQGARGTGRESGQEQAGRLVERRGAEMQRDADRSRGIERRSDVRPAIVAPELRRADVRPEERRVRVVERGRYGLRPNVLTDCPPGLAKKNNGCLPPGQERKLVLANSAGGDLNRYATWYDQARSDDWRYWNGYAYRVDPATRLASAFMPLLGGALFSGNPWPASYTDYRVDPYYVRYYGYDDDYDYRFADGALFAVDPRDQEIEAIAALLAGDPWAVGRPMPLGYSVYNVPPAYRDRYWDSDEAWYRYSDGYVYRIDPTTQLVAAIIQLLA